MTRRRIRLCRAVAAGLVAIAVSGSGSAVAAETPTPVPGPVVLIGVGGLRWDDVTSSTPALNSLQSGAIGQLAVRSVRSYACPVDGWLAVSAGRRASDVDLAGDERGAVCRDAAPLSVAAPGGAAQVPRWSQYVQAAAAESFEAHPGLLGSSLANAGKTAVAVGPGAAIALGVPGPGAETASVPRAFAGRVDDGRGTADPALVADDVQRALALQPDLLAVDLGSIRDPARQIDDSPPLTGAYTARRQEQVARLDSRLGLVLGQLPRSATVIVASIADDGVPSRLRLLAATGRAPAVPGQEASSYSEALLGSNSTRQDGLAQTTDLMPTLLDALGVERPPSSVGSTLEPVRAGDDVVERLQRLDDLDGAAMAVNPIVPWFFNGIVIAQILLYGLATVILRRRGGPAARPAAAPAGRRRTLRALHGTAVAFACVPAATFLANLLPWWRSDVPGLAVTLAVVAFALPITLLALLGPWRRDLLGSLGVVGGVTAAVLAADVSTGSHLMLSSLMGVQPVVAGRFYGFSNPGFALFATGSLLLAVALAHRATQAGRPRAAVVVVVVIGVVATVIDGTPGLGSDFGGPPAIIPAFGVLALLVAGVAITWRRALLIAAVTVVVLGALSLADWLRPAGDRTHLGRFVQTLIDGGAWPVIRRKAEQNVRILFTSWLSALLPVAVAFVVLVLARPVAWGVRPLQLAYDRSPVLRHGMVAFAVLMAFGFALNDSGTAIPAVAATVAIPLLIAVSARALEEDDAEHLEAAVARARRSPLRGSRP